MPNGKYVKSDWSSGNLRFIDKNGVVIFTVDGANRKLTLPTGSTLDISAATLSGSSIFSVSSGYINLPLTSFRLTAANDIAAKNAADGGVISLDTDPTLKRVNGATDKQLRIAWAANSVVEIQAPSFAYPADLDDTAAVNVNLLVAKDANVNTTATIAVSYWEGVGDTNAGGNTAALTETTPTIKTVAIAHGDIGAYPKVASVGLIPSAHANDAIYLYAAWISYTRKLS